MKKLVTILACLMLSVFFTASINAAGNLPSGVLESEVITTGSVFYVCSANGSDNYSGTSKNYPVATIDKAINLCTANKSDVIYVMANHAETLTTAGAITCDIEGISIIGLGNGDNRGTVTLNGILADASDVGIDIKVTADNVTIKNLRFISEVDALTDMIECDTTAYTFIDNCYFEMSDADSQAECAIDITGSCTFAKITNCEFYAYDAGGQQAIHIGTGGAVPDRLRIIDNVIHGNFSTACIYSTVAATYISINRNVLHNVNSGSHCIELTGAATGVISYNVGYTDMTQATGIDEGVCTLIENYTTDDTTVSGILTPLET